MGDAAEAWREAVADSCEKCGDDLALLEGPFCDDCVTQPLPLGMDKYLGFRDEEARAERHAELAESVGPSTGQDSFAVNLETLEIVLCR